MRRFLRLRTFALIAAGGVMLVGYTNCAEPFAGGEFAASVADDGGGRGSPGSLCEQDLRAAFQSSYHSKLLRARCVSCHGEAGSSPIKIAATDVAQAFGTFKLVRDAVDTNSVLPSHAPGVTGPSLQTLVNEQSAAYDAALVAFDTCLANSGGGQTPGQTAMDLAERADPSMYFAGMPNGQTQYGTSKTFTWELGSSDAVPSNARFPATFKIDARLFYRTIDGVQRQGYAFARPRLQMHIGDKQAEVTNIIVKVNGILVDVGSFKDATTIIRGIDEKVIANYEVHSELGAVSNSDKISVSFGALTLTNRTDTPIPMPAPTLTITPDYISDQDVNDGNANAPNSIPLTITNDGTARRWCLTTSAVTPSSAAICPGMEAKPNGGWLTVRPTSFLKNDIFPLPQDGQTIRIYLHVANSDLQMNNASDTVIYDTTEPDRPTLTGFSHDDTQVVELLGIQNYPAGHQYCVTTSTTTQNFDNDTCNGGFSATKPQYFYLPGAGTRYFKVVVRDPAGNVMRDQQTNFMSTSTAYSAIRYVELMGNLGGRSVFQRHCASCHTGGGTGVSVWDASNYPGDSGLRTRIRNYSNPVSNPAGHPDMTAREYKLIEAWIANPNQ